MDEATQETNQDADDERRTILARKSRGAELRRARDTTTNITRPLTGSAPKRRRNIPAKSFDEIEDTVALDYEKHEPGSALPWDQARHASRAAWTKVSGVTTPRDVSRGTRGIHLLEAVTMRAEDCSCAVEWPKGAELLTPLVLRIFPLQLLFDLRITFLPEGREIIRDLDRAMIRRQHLDPQRHPAGPDRESALHSVEILDARGDRRRRVRRRR